ncbi:ELWxxDGT repeat protein [Geobacter sp. DSM 9736]|uniref:ELWxxDGT repeat protein n=1 Tax=Geobacter sp. DSM 9736 TaxID=1277350 RepID=UPI000B512E01|nr:ELWxxDGT repeat protein [Geobacter sp. DSM 9736]SNB46232.1 ELWxxDGT repeat-containing protein [Geobacter sp. DSM 9736]
MEIPFTATRTIASKLLQLIRVCLFLLLVIPVHAGAAGHPYVPREINSAGNSIDPYKVNQLVAIEGSVVFPAGDGATGTELWKSDGTAEGTVLMKDILPGPEGSNPSGLIRLNGKIVFRAADTGHGMEPWVTDGTPEGTYMLADINPGATGSNPVRFTVVGDVLYFGATTPTGNKLFRTDGTPAGTRIATEFTPTGGVSGIDSFTSGHGKLLVASYLSGITRTWTIWSVDPVIGTTDRISSFLSQPKNMTPCGGRTFFSLSSEPYGEELWVTDGSESGTVMVKDIYAGGSSSPSGLHCGDSTLYFSAGEPSSGTELWKSDGTGAGTILVKDINPGAPGSYPWGIKAMNGRVFFSASGPGTGSELWVSDGSDTGTSMVKEISPGSGSSYPGDLTVAGSLLAFTASNAVHGEEVWVTDGTTETTFLLADLNPGSSHSAARSFTQAGDTLFFSAYDGSGRYKLFAAALAPAPHSLILSPSTGVVVSSPTVLITGESHTDTGKPLAFIEVSTDNGISWNSAGGTAAWSYTFQASADGIYTLLARGTDAAGTEEIPGPGIRLTVDTAPPAGTVRIDNDAATTSSTGVLISIHATAQDPGVSCSGIYPRICGELFIRFSNDATVWSDWEPAQPERNWTLSTGDGEKTIYAELRDLAGNTALFGDTIILDTSDVPTSTITSPGTGSATNGSVLSVSGTASPGPAGGTVVLVEVSVDDGTTWYAAAGTSMWTIDIPLSNQEGSYTIRSRASTDLHVETPGTGVTIRVDRTPPQGTLALYYGEWTLNAADNGHTCFLVYPSICGPVEMSRDGSEWQQATTRPGTGGPLWLRDNAGNLSHIPAGRYDNSNGGPVMVERSVPVYYSFLQHAYGAAEEGDLIKLSAPLAESIIFSRTTSLTIRGGYAGNYGAILGTTAITGSVRVLAGSTAIENVEVSGTITVEGGNLALSSVSVR